MSRNDIERTGAHASQEAPPEVLQGLSFVAPTELVDLPSKGSYPEGHPLHGKETIEIRFMTAKDEDILTNQSLLKKGVAIERFLKNVIIDKNVNTDHLYIGDRNAILIAARISGYGASYETKVNCPHCGEVNRVNFDLTSPQISEPKIDEKYNMVVEEGNYFVTTPLSKLKIGLRILTGKDENYLTKRLTDKKTKDLANVTEQFRLMISSVQGDSSRKTIDYYVENMPTQDSTYLRAAYAMINPSVKIVDDFECRSCGYEQELEVPFGADFFWPNR